MNRVLFIGGPGNISSSTAADLLERGDKVAVFTLPGSSDDESLGPKLKMYWGNRNHPDEIESAMNDFNPDIVIDYSCFSPDQAEQLLKIIYGRLKQFIFISTVDVYGFPLSRLPMREDDPWGLPNCTYAADKRACEELYWSKFHKEKFPLTVVRPAYSMGKRFVLTDLTRNGGEYLIPRLRTGMPVLVVGDGTTLIHVSSSYNTGRMIARLAGNETSIGKSYTCGHNTFTTHDGYIKIFAGVLGVEANIIHVPSDLLNSMNSKEINESILNILTRHNVAFSVDNFIKDFPDFKWDKSLEDAAREYVEWNDHMGNFADVNEEIFEDRIIKTWQACAKNFRVNSEGIHFEP